ncbi:MAG: hypothetical protein KDJ31_19890, partial [Candidatus Competibacteraceae bacterium]|nr:hypothetical protein [Candidatus Competibacteraceae bacterium]
MPHDREERFDTAFPGVTFEVNKRSLAENHFGIAGVAGVYDARGLPGTEKMTNRSTAARSGQKIS